MNNFDCLKPKGDAAVAASDIGSMLACKFNWWAKRCLLDFQKRCSLSFVAEKKGAKYERKIREKGQFYKTSKAMLTFDSES